MPKIENVHAREVLDSRGNPTVEVEVTLENGMTDICSAELVGKAIVPSGASTGIHEALELRDGDKNRYGGKWVLKAVGNVNTILKDNIVWKDFADFHELDKFMIELDWTKNKSKFGANAILWISMAFVDACAKGEWKWIYEYLGKGEGITLPYPMMNILNWWSHADNNVDIQEFMIVPIWAKNIKEAVRMWAEVFHTLKKILKSKWHVTSVWDEGWYAPNLGSNEEAFKVIVDAIWQAGYNTDQIKLAIDAAASEFYKDGKYVLSGEWKTLNASELVDLYASRCEKYPIMSIEDSHAEDDFDWWKLAEKKLWSKVMTVWDDLLVTNIERLKMGIEDNLCNSILIKLNQIGSVSETIAAVNMAHKNNMKSVISHRSGETENTFIADLAVALNTGFIKTGSLSRSERIAKYNQLIRIEEKIGERAKYGK